MYRDDLRELLVDVRAAARLGDAESIGIALAGLLDWPEVAGNPDMEPAFVSQVLAPVGAALAAPGVPTNLLLGMAQDSQAAFRALAAAALCSRALAGDTPACRTLNDLANDHRPEVRQAIAIALRPQRAEPAAQTLLAEWAASDKPKWQALAAEILAG